jgi:TRAP-type mannitol/chloroaromatic compound transport system permease small subunit
MRPWLRLANGIDHFNEWIGRALCWLTLVMVLVGSYNAIVRYLAQFAGTDPESAGVFEKVLISIGEVAVPLNSNGFIELQWYLFSLVFLLGAAYTLKHNAHVRVDVLYGRLSAKGKAWINLLGTLLFLIPFCVLMLWTAWPAVQESWSLREMSSDPGGLPRYPIKTVIPIAFMFLLVQGVAMLIRQVAILRGVLPGEVSAEVVEGV